MNPQFEELACLYVLDQLDPRERAAFEVRRAHDPELAALVQELESALAQRVHALPQHEPPAGLLARIEARLDRLPAAETPVPARTVESRWTAIARWGLAAVIAIGLGTLAVQSLRRPPAARPYVIVVGLDSRRSTLTELPMREGSQNVDARFIQLASLAEQYWDKPGDLPVRMNSAGPSDHGYAIFDPGSNQGFIGIEQLSAAEPGQRFHLWIVDTATGQAREAGVLPDTGASRGLYSFSVAPTGGAKSGGLDFFVTAEDAAALDATQPRGKVVLGEKRF